MKRIFTLVLAIIMVMSLATTAFADTFVGTDIQESTGSANFNIMGRLETDVQYYEVVSVDLSYGSMSFVYVSEDNGGSIWDPATHTYTGNNFRGGTWKAENKSNIIKVTNHSNIDVVIDGGVEIADAYVEDGNTSNSINGHIYFDAWGASTSGVSEVTGNLGTENSQITLAKGELNKKDAADSIDLTVEIGGYNTNFTSETASVIGNVTLTIYRGEDHSFYKRICTNADSYNRVNQ